MAARATPNTSAVVMAFAERFRSADECRGIWYRERGPLTELGLVTDPIDLPGERHLRALGLEVSAAFRDVTVDFHILNSRLVGDDPQGLVPAGAEYHPIR